MGYFLGIDGGGTKTDCVLMDEDGAVLESVQGAASNPLRTSYPKAWFALSATTDLVLARKRIKAHDILGIHAGLGGAGRQQVVRSVTTFLERSFPNAAVRVTSDLEIALAAVAGEATGVVLIAGTGSCAYGRNDSGETARAGGLGPWLGDEGSAFDIGRSALRAVARAADSRGPETNLSERALRDIGCADWNAVYDRIAKSPDDVFPRLFASVLAAAKAGDEVSLNILESAAAALAEITASVVAKLKFSEAEFPLGKVGGVFGRSPLLDAPLEQQLARIAPRAHIGLPKISPAQAAAQMAMDAHRETARALR